MFARSLHRLMFRPQRLRSSTFMLHVRLLVPKGRQEDQLQSTWLMQDPLESDSSILQLHFARGNVEWSYGLPCLLNTAIEEESR